MEAMSRGEANWLEREFFARPVRVVARDLIGCTLWWDGCAGEVLETEAYGAVGDPACHTAHRPSSRAFMAAHPPGTAYVYLNYGMYWLLNVLAGDGIVLFRALHPVTGLAEMGARRGTTELRALCSGPGKLGRALGLSGADHGVALGPWAGPEKARRGLTGRAFGKKWPVVTDRRVGISQAVDRRWRYLAAGHAGVSVPPGRA